MNRAPRHAKVTHRTKKGNRYTQPIWMCAWFLAIVTWACTPFAGGGTYIFALSNTAIICGLWFAWVVILAVTMVVRDHYRTRYAKDLLRRL